MVLSAVVGVCAQEGPVQDLGSTDVVSESPSVSQKSTSVTEITKDAWEGKPYSAAELLATLPGIQYYRQGGLGSFQTISIRGIAAKNIVICMDGVPMNDGSGGAVDLGQIDLNQIEKIEVYKDRVPAKFGGAGIGGAVNFVTKSAIVRDASGKKTYGQILASYGSHNFWEGSAQVLHQITDSVSFAATLSARHSDNDYEFINRNGTKYNKDDDYTDVRRNAQYTEYSGNVKYRVLHKFGGFSTFSLTASMSDAGNPGREDYQTTFAGFDGENARASYRMEFPEFFGWLWLEMGLTGEFEKSVSHSYYPMDHIGYVSTEYLEYGTGGYKFIPEVIASYYGERLDVNLRLAGGADYYTPRGNSTSWALDRYSLSLAGDGEFRILPWIAVGAEGSLLGVSDDIHGGTIVLPTFSKNLDDSAERNLSYSARGIVKVGKDDSRFGGSASFGRFYQKPDLMELYGVYPGVISNPELKDEVAYRFETSVFAATENRRTILRATYYSTVMENGIFWVNSASFMKPFNLDDARIMGLEFEMESNPAKSVRTILRATFQDAVDKSDEKAYRNNKLPGEPARSYFAELQLDLPLHFDFTWSSNYRTKIYSDRANRMEQPGVGIHKAVLGFKPFESTRLAFSVDNISDETYRNFYTPFPTPGREYKLTLTQGF
ncbi:MULTISPECIES: TonB-dependent receptor [unclassified Fibrobacter]|uniref:TonB-dependent receptor n=1 Tax=unclassified Fibrobacter TaxID=2634177 RepID=UPI00130490C2|nr:MULTISPECIES: TonB-dependent receptor plug domain-containing protein [unclassified Fibrobacter]